MTLALNLAAAALLILIIIGGWALLSRLKPLGRQRFGGWARAEGTCGSHLEIGLDLADGRVNRTVCRAEGCGYDCACLHAAGRLAKGKTPVELMRIDAEAIQRAVGDLPDDHLHCAQTAAQALHAAAQDCFKGRGPGKPRPTADSRTDLDLGDPPCCKSHARRIDAR